MYASRGKSTTRASARRARENHCRNGRGNSAARRADRAADGGGGDAQRGAGKELLERWKTSVERLPQGTGETTPQQTEPDPRTKEKAGCPYTVRVAALLGWVRGTIGGGAWVGWRAVAAPSGVVRVRGTTGGGAWVWWRCGYGIVSGDAGGRPQGPPLHGPGCGIVGG
jgi:hypothetical protein